MRIGYARVSTHNQDYGLAAQVEELQKADCEKIISEEAGATGKRLEFERTLEFLREGDVLVVTKLDRLARSVAHLGQILVDLRDNGVELIILNLGIDTSTATGKLMLNLLGSVAEFEREMLLERQREGIERAKAEGKYRGGKKQVNRDEVLRLKGDGLGPSAIAKQMGVGRASVYRVLGEKP